MKNIVKRISHTKLEINSYRHRHIITNFAQNNRHGMNIIEYRVGEYVIAHGIICKVIKRVNKLDYLISNSSALKNARVRSNLIRPFWIQAGFKFVVNKFGVPTYIIVDQVELVNKITANFTYRIYTKNGVTDNSLHYMLVEDFRKQKPELFIE